MKPIYLFLAALAVTACNSNASTPGNPPTVEQQQNGTPKAVKTIRSAEAKALIEKQKDLVILDVRTPQEFAGGHLKNALLLNKYAPDFETSLKALDRNKPYLLYCAVGGRSGEAARQMQQLGFTQIYDATEGFNPLKDAGVPIEK